MEGKPGMRVYFPGCSRLSILFLMLCLSAVVKAAGQGPKPNLPPGTHPPSEPAPTASPRGHEMTAVDVEAFLDGLIPLQLQRDDIGGAVIVVVKDGKILFAKGYGYADVEKRVPVVAQDTLFRPGSVGKLFTWTAVMQLVEKGKLDLDRDVNEYLDFSLPHTFGKPLILRNAMTHTPGFEEAIKNTQANTPGEIESLRSLVVNHPPQQIFAPGTIPAYSNYGADVAGYIVQRVSGQPFEGYVAEHIFKPLGMRHATYMQPPPKDLLPFMAKGYAVASEEAKPFELLAPQPGPDGTMSVSGIDMAHFMIAHLQNGEYEGHRILSAATAQLMRTRQFGMDPNLNGMDLGFIEAKRNGMHIVGHDGDTNYFHSDLELFPDINLGYFVSYNSSGNGEEDARTSLRESFLDRYFPYTPPAETTSAQAARDGALVVGPYLSSRREQTTILSALWLLFGEAMVSTNPDGTIEVDQIKGTNGKAKRWRDIGNLTFREVNGQEKLIFRRDQAGRLEMLTGDPTFIYQGVSWSQNKNVLRDIGVLILAMSLLTPLLWPVAAIVREHYGQKLNSSVAERKFRVLARIVSGVNLVFLISFSAIVAIGIGNASLFSDKLDPWLHLLQLVGWIGVLGTAAVAYRSFILWRTSEVGLWTRLYSAGFTLACLGYVWFIVSFHMLRPTLVY
jgi:CubicO group peptidase (beta-lactamase class C family)